MVGGIDLVAVLAAVRDPGHRGPLPWSAAEMDAVLADSLDALELFVALDDRMDGETLDRLMAQGESLGELTARLLSEPEEEGHR
jgi:hypothetical protein